MKVRKLDLRNYDFAMVLPNGQTLDSPYLVRESIVELLLPQKHTAVSLRKHGKLADAILEEKGDYILLQEAEYAMLTAKLNECETLGKNDLKLVERIQDCPEVDVSEDKVTPVRVAKG